jgi:hypothetical protein
VLPILTFKFRILILCTVFYAVRYVFDVVSIKHKSIITRTKRQYTKCMYKFDLGLIIAII